MLMRQILRNHVRIKWVLRQLHLETSCVFFTLVSANVGLKVGLHPCRVMLGVSADTFLILKTLLRGFCYF
jgi:hypothetical protein